MQTPDQFHPLEPMDEIREYLQRWFPDFAYSKRDDYFFAALHVEFRDLDILDEIKSFHAWCLDKAAQDMSYRLGFRRWLAKGATYRSNRSR